MSLQVLNIPADSKEVVDFLSAFKFKTEPQRYINAMLQKMKEHWGDDLGGDQAGYIDGTIDVVENGLLVYPFKDLMDEKINTYLSEKIGDFSLYARLWNYTPDEYEIDVPFNLNSSQDEYWVDLSLSLDGNFNVRSASVAYDSDEPSHKLLTYWALKQSN